MRNFLPSFLLAVACAAECSADATQGALTLVATDSNSSSPNTIHAISLSTGASTPIGPTGASPVMAGLAYDAFRGILYGTTTGSNSLYTIDVQRGSATPIGPLGVPLMHGLAFDHASGMLFGAFGRLTQPSLYRIDPASGQASLVGPLGEFNGNHVSGMTFHPETNVLYGSLSGPVIGGGGIVTINTTTGAATQVATLDTNLAGLAFHPFTGELYGVNNQGLDRLYKVDIAGETLTLVGATGLENNLGLEFVGYRIPEPASVAVAAAGMLLLQVGARRRVGREGGC